MPHRSKPLLLLTVIAIALASWGEPMPLLQVQSRPAGCHQHTKPASVPAPASYRCCVVGHQQALPQEFSVLHPVLPIRFTEVAGEQSQSATPGLRFLAQVTPTEGPPGATFLRI